MLIRRLLVFAVMGALLFAILWRVDPPMPDVLARQPRPEAISTAGEPSPAEILARVAQAYSSCRTYADEAVERKTLVDKKEYVVQSTSTTRFDRSLGLRYVRVRRTPASLLEIWFSRGERSVTEGFVDAASGWRGRSRDGTEVSLKDAFAHSSVDRAFLFTNLASWLLPTAAIDDSWEDWVKLQVVGIETIDEHACWRVNGVRFGTDMDLWFDRESYLVRRASLTFVTEDHERMTMQIAIDPQFDVPIDPEDLPSRQSP